MQLISIDKLEPDTEWDDYEDGFLSYSYLQINSSETIDVDNCKNVYDLLDSLHDKILHSKFAETVSENEINAFVYVKDIMKKLEELEVK